MKESFQLPNEVCCSTSGVSGSVQNALNKKRMSIDGIKKISVVSTSISRSSKINPVNIESDNGMAAGAKTLTEQATALRRLKLVCIFLAMSTAIITATFGGLIHTLMKRVDNHDRISEKLESSMGRPLAKSPTKPTNAPDIETRLLNLESYQTQDRIELKNIGTRIGNIESNLDTHIETRLTNIESDRLKSEPNQTENYVEYLETRLLNLETYQTQDRIEFREIGTRTDKLESDLNAYTTTVQENSKILRTIETDMDIERQTLRNLSAFVNVINKGSTTEYLTIQEYINETSTIWTNIERESTINEEHSTAISQLETDWHFVTALVQNHTSQITQLETDRTTDHSLVELHDTRVKQLEADLATESSIIKTHSDSILAISDSLLQLEAGTIAQNASFQANNDRLAQLELDRSTILLQESRIMYLEANLTTLNVTFHTLSSRIEELESDQGLDQDMLSNHNARIIQLEEILDDQNASLQMEKSINRDQDTRLLELELDANATRTILEDVSARLINNTVDGQWTTWLQWSSCSVTCGSGRTTRQRTCSNPGPANGGHNCLGASTEHVTCQLATCPVNGGWSSWSSWTSCSRSCNGGERSRHRTCSNPSPTGLGRQCVGNSDQASVCNGHPCQVNGAWSSWSSWSSCTKSCNVGERRRHRTCSQPSPSAAGRACIGNSDDVSICSAVPCPGYQIGFSASGGNILSSAIVQFNNVKSNYGSGYSSATGKFTCSLPGLYYFSTSLIKSRNYFSKVDRITCIIYKNTTHLVNTTTDPTDDDTDKGSYETSAFIVVHLYSSDQVYVTCTTGTLEGWSSFSGFLLESD